MQQVIIENPILNSPFEEPTRHFKFSDEGITNEIVEARRVSSYFIPIAKPKKKGKATQLAFDTEWTRHRPVLVLHQEPGLSYHPDLR
jgi:type III restriction enzyme